MLFLTRPIRAKIRESLIPVLASASLDEGKTSGLPSATPVGHRTVPWEIVILSEALSCPTDKTIISSAGGIHGSRQAVIYDYGRPERLFTTIHPP
jgi:hypothetical protein